MAGEFALESSKTATKHMDLAPYFALSQQGRYAIVATVKIKDWDHQIVSVPKPFYIMEGSRLWEQAFGVPKLAGVSNTPPEVRKYILQQANYLKGPLRLYFRLTDDSGARTFRVFPIGQMVSFSRPDPQVDKLSNLHVLYQSGPQSYSYTALNPEGELIARQVYDYVGTRPRLQPNEDGSISVMGGVRRLTANDLPASKLETDTNAGSESPR